MIHLKDFSDAKKH